MADKPILFSGPMVVALLADTKTQTRRIIKPQPTAPGDVMVGDRKISAAEWQIRYDRRITIAVGDRLWVREAHAIVPRTAYRMSEGVQQTLRPDDDHYACVYAEGWERSMPGPWKPSIFMPRWASRITLVVTDVKVERLQDINEADAIAEGCAGHLGPNPDFPDEWDPSPVEQYRDLWNTINGPGAWDANPWVCAYTFRVIVGNIDQIGGDA